MKKLLNMTLGIVTSIGGFLEVGSIGTALQAGANFGYQLIWAILLGTLCLIFLIEMSGRLAAASRRPFTAAVRERFGIAFQIVPLSAQLLVDLLVLMAEVGGVALALEFLSGVAFRWWVVPVALLIWALLWKGTFGMVENAIAVLGLVTLAFAVGAFRLHPPIHDLLRGAVPSRPDSDLAHYAFLAVSIIGATISPYLISFYSSGAVEEKWKEDDILPNRVVAGLGITFGAMVSVSVLVVAALVLRPAGITVETYDQAIAVLTPMFRHQWGFYLFAISLAIGCFGAAMEISLDAGYILAQAFGWKWSENQKPKDDARFSATYTLVLAVAALVMLSGIDPLKLTMFSMALSVVILPLVIFPLLVLMNDPDYVGDHPNGWVTNTAVVLITVIAFGIAVVAIPLEFLGA